MSGKKYVVAILILSACAAGYAAFRPMLQAQAKAKTVVPLGYADENDSTSAQADTKLENIATVQPEVVLEDNFLRLTGSLVADQKSEVASTANGIVQEVKVERGSLVRKGDVLVVVDPTDAQNALNEAHAAAAELRAALGWDDTTKPFDPEQHPNVRAARAAMDLAKTTLDRYTALLAKGAIAQNVLDQAKTQFDTAEQQYQQALQGTRQMYQSLQTVLAKTKTVEKIVADTVITAPFDGWVAEKYVSNGERVSTNPMGAGAKVVSLVALDPLRLVLTVPQQYAAEVSQGQKVTFTVETFPDKTFSAEVRYVGPSLESHTRSLTVEAIVANTDGALRPGFFANADLILPGQTERLTIPASAVVRSGDVSRVYVVDKGTAVERVIDVESTQGDRVVVKSGISANDAVVITPEEKTNADEAQS
ncbi:MAG: efflux RND transporter periplasmic adaptor subunit [Candidatus Hydrogenedentes bacterium]|nr:efflux RND transporter periplasmic adaptor subunit [Candidatus Hydrogenedentota bacterium]